MEINWISITDKAGNQQVIENGKDYDGTFTVNSPNADTIKPVLKEVKVDKTQVKQGGKINVSVLAEDNLGVNNVVVFARNVTNTSFQFMNVRLIEGNGLKGTWQGELQIPKDAPTGQWFISEVLLYDVSGNWQSYYDREVYDRENTMERVNFNVIDEFQIAEDAVEKSERLSNVDLSNSTAIEQAKTALEEAEQLVNQLSDGDAKTSLQDRINKVKDILLIAVASNLVQIAEETKLQSDVDKARIAVTSLNDNETKDALTKRIETVQKYINAKNLLLQILNGDLKAYQNIDAAIDTLNDAQNIISTLPVSNNTNLSELYKSANSRIVESLISLLSTKENGTPYRLSDKSLNLLVIYSIQKVEAVSKQDKGKVMDYLMPILNSHATGEDIDLLLDKYLN